MSKLTTFSELSNMFLHRLPNGKLTLHEGLPRELAIKRMEDHERWVQEHREELRLVLNNCSTICSEVDVMLNTMTKTQVMRVVRDVATKKANLSREEKQQFSIMWLMVYIERDVFPANK